jgi:hypothetical protein
MSDDALLSAALFLLHGTAWLSIGMVIGRWIWGE